MRENWLKQTEIHCYYYYFCYHYNHLHFREINNNDDKEEVITRSLQYVELPHVHTKTLKKLI